MAESPFAGLFVTATMAEVSRNAADALTKATEALRDASEAMYRASQTYNSPTSTTSSKTFVAGPPMKLSFLHDDPFPGTFVPRRASSLNQTYSDTRKWNLPEAKLLRPPEPTHPPERMRSRASRGYSHIDLLERAAISRRESLRDNTDTINGSLGRAPSKYSSYSEDVADRNMSWSTSTELLNPAAANHHDAIRMPLPQEIAFVGVVCLAQFLALSSLSCTIAPLPYITSTFNEPLSPTWYSAAFSLTLGTFILPSGRFGDVFGHKNVFLVGWAYFGLLSLACGFGPLLAIRLGRDSGNGAEIFFIVMRALQGIGPAILMPNGMALLGRVYVAGTKKNLIFALFGWFAPVGFVGGAALSCLIAQSIGWEWMFWILCIVCAVTGVVAWRVVPELATRDGNESEEESNKASPTQPSSSDNSTTSIRQLFARLDIFSSLLGTSALILLNISLNQAPLILWSTPYTYFLLIISLILLTAFLITQRPKYNSHPLLPLDVMDSSTLFVLACTGLGWAAFGIWVFYTFTYLMAVPIGGPVLSPMNAVAWFTPAPLSGLFASAATGILSGKLHPRWIMLFAMLAFFIGIVVITFTTHSSLAQMYLRTSKYYFTTVFWSVLIMPWGMEMSFPSATILLSDSVGSERQGVAASLVMTVVNYGISLGLGVAGTVVRYTGKDDNGGVDGMLTVADCRHAWFSGLGLSGLGVGVAGVFVFLGFWSGRRRKGGVGRV